MVGDADAEVLGYRAFLQSRAAAGNALAQDVLALLGSGWSEPASRFRYASGMSSPLVNADARPVGDC